LRNTQTGAVLEAMVLPALKLGGYEVTTQVGVGERPGGGRHFADAIASREGRRFVLSLKWQQSSGTAEQKVPFEVICLAKALREHDFAKAYLVLGGDGWTLREFYASGGLRPYLTSSEQVEIVTRETFVGLANRSAL
jgi:hypothetical protein